MIRGVSLKSVEEPLKNLVAMGAINLDELLEYRHINDRSCARLAAIHHKRHRTAVKDISVCCILLDQFIVSIRKRLWQH